MGELSVRGLYRLSGAKGVKGKRRADMIWKSLTKKNSD
jgi:hypothetical protein